MLNYLKDDPKGKVVIPNLNIHWLSIVYFCFFTILGFYLFATKPEKGQLPAVFLNHGRRESREIGHALEDLR